MTRRLHSTWLAWALAFGCTLAQADTGQVERGRYLARLGDCISCHTAKGGQPFAGGFAIDTGFGTVYSPNITSDRDTGIGGWSNDQFYRALHAGKDDAGRHLYPAFPYVWFTKVTRTDADALKAYFDSVAPVHRQNKPPRLPWWLSWRFEITGWNLLNFDQGEFRPDPQQSAQWNRGAYIVDGLGHCGACHTEKRFFGGTVSADMLAGGYTQGGYDNGWFAPSLRGERRAGLGDWSLNDIVSYLKTGSNDRTAAAGPMDEVVRNSTSQYTDADLSAVAVYLKSLAPRHDTPKPIAFSRRAMTHGQDLFTDNCAACHMHDGGGIRGFFPALQGSSAIQARQPASVLRVVLQGAQLPAKAGQHGFVAMPGFADKLTDREIADLVNYIRNAWGNRGSVVDVDTVAKQRQALAQNTQ